VLSSGGRSSGQPPLSVRLLLPDQRTEEPSRQRRQLPLSVSGKNETSNYESTHCIPYLAEKRKEKSNHLLVAHAKLGRK